MSEQDVNQNQNEQPIEPESPEPELSFLQYTGGVLGTTFSLFKNALYVIPIVVVVVIVVLALTGPAIGNVFSNVVSSL